MATSTSEQVWCSFPICSIFRDLLNLIRRFPRAIESFVACTESTMVLPCLAKLFSRSVDKYTGTREPVKPMSTDATDNTQELKVPKTLRVAIVYYTDPK